MSSFSPTPQQTLAIDYTRSMVITACPGSGKTTVIKEKIRNITSNLPEHKGVIAITFTRKASAELETRCKAEAHNTKYSFFGTIDSFCLDEIIIPFLSRIWGGTPKKCKVLKKLATPYADFIEEDFIGTPSIIHINEDSGYKRLYNEGILWMGSFAALALKVLNDSLSARRYIKSRYTHIFIDEYQDSSLAQHQLFLKINELGLCSIAVGDVCQSIYKFRGGDSKLLLELVNNIESFKHFEININHRCHPSIFNYASRLLIPDYDLQPTEEIRVYRKRMKGNYKDIATEISKLISKCLVKKVGGLAKAAQIAILAKKKDTLTLLCSGLHIKFRLYIDTPLDEIDANCVDLYKSLLLYKYGTISTAQELIDRITVSNNMQLLLRKKVKIIRENLPNEELLDKFHEIANILSIEFTEKEDNALIETISNKIFIKQFKPLDDREVQVMTLHKSKGLEFKIVFHLDLEEWSFPYREVVKNSDIPKYTTLQQDLNLHYVGITRAEDYCILISSEFRQNSNGKFKKSEESYFLKLPQLNDLYKIQN